MSKDKHKKSPASGQKGKKKTLKSLMQLCGLLDVYVDTQDWECDDKERIAQAWEILVSKGISPAMVEQSIQPASAKDPLLDVGAHPGPWHVEGTEIRCEPDEHDGGRVICEMISSRSIGETHCNALLIRNAPEMRALLEDIVSTRSDITKLGLSLVSLDVIEKAQDLLDSMFRTPILLENRPSELSQHSCEEIPIPSKQASTPLCPPSSSKL